MEELKKDFPIIVRGKVTERTKSTKEEDQFALKIQIQNVLHGKIKTKNLKASEIHYGKDFWRIYEVGKEYTFLITPKGKDYEVTLPMDGCPDLPSSDK
ncbi:MAG: hypothetical protein COT73_08055 [Bdellovibrio sp. CG10_big_fil_rev_8_21_14_0_10_47_8]|nr:MAG: hypothetical protein COT73_08055 [Bdellovibrio sp. CG10_big_fil_rev_8_21_14_0_10_47_8]